MNPFADQPSSRGGSASTPATPPPPYESVMEGSDNGFGPSLSTPSQPPEFDIVVDNPLKQGEGVQAFVSYKVRTRTTLPQYKSKSSEVIRRFRDFTALHARLGEANRGVILPPLPEKNAVQKFQMDTDFIEQRRRALQVFINRVAVHPVLKSSRELQAFLEASEDEWSLEVAHAQGTGSKIALSTASGWFRTLGHSASNLVAGKTDDSLEDPEYIKVKEYINSLEGHLVEAHRQACRLIRKERELGVSLAEFGASVDKLGRLEEGNLQEAFVQLSSKASQLATASRERTEQLAANFEAPLKEAARAIKSVQQAIADRAASLAGLQLAKSDLDSRKVRLNKLRTTPGGQQENKLADAERELRDADQRVKNAKIAYESIVARMTEELNRYQKERASDMTTLLREFALTQAHLARDNSIAWGALLADLQTLVGAT